MFTWYLFKTKHGGKVTWLFLHLLLRAFIFKCLKTNIYKKFLIFNLILSDFLPWNKSREKIKIWYIPRKHLSALILTLNYWNILNTFLTACSQNNKDSAFKNCLQFIVSHRVSALDVGQEQEEKVPTFRPLWGFKISMQCHFPRPQNFTQDRGGLHIPILPAITQM